MARRISLSALRRDTRGAVAIETAIIAPVLVLMSVGGFQVSRMVSRQAELQSAAAEGAAIALANKPDTQTKLDNLASIMRQSTGLGTNGVSITAQYRCGAQTTIRTSSTECGTEKVARYVKIQLTQTYVPIWAKYGVGSSLRFGVTRYVMYSQSS